MSRFVFSLGLMFFSLVVGYIIRVLAERQTRRLPLKLLKIRKFLQKLVVLFFIPVAFMGAVWIVDLDDLRILVLPILGVFAIVLGGVLAYGFARAQRLTRKQTGSYIVSGAFTNIGSIGGLICYIFLGEAAFAMVPLYKLLEELTYFAFGFPLAKSFSLDRGNTESLGTRFKKVIKDPFAFVPAGSIGVGIVLNLTGVLRPEFYTRLNAILIPTTSVLLLLSIGISMRFGSLRTYMKQSAIMALIKHAMVPVTVTAIALAFRFGNIADGLPLKVVLILSSMPVGFIGMVPPTIYNLDLELANSNWLFTNALLFIVVPTLFFLVQLF